MSHLSRLSQKPGVQSTLILSRETGAIVQSSGLESLDEPSSPDSTLLPSSTLTNGNVEIKGTKMQVAEDVARLVYKFVKAAGDMVQELNGTQDDELKLLRLRTKKNELVIVPGKGDLVRSLYNADRFKMSSTLLWSFMIHLRREVLRLLLRDPTTRKLGLHSELSRSWVAAKPETHMQMVIPPAAQGHITSVSPISRPH